MSEILKSIPEDMRFPTPNKERINDYFIYCWTHKVLVHSGNTQSDHQVSGESMSIDRHHLLYEVKEPCVLLRYIPYYGEIPTQKRLR